MIPDRARTAPVLRRLTRNPHALGIAAAIATISAVGVGLSLGLPLLSLVLEDRGFPSTLIGINTATSGIAALAVTPFVPRWSAWVGTARLTLIFIAITAGSFAAFYLAPDFWMWFPLRIAFHGAITGLFIISEFWINALAPQHRRGLVMGIYATMLAVGFAVGPTMLGVIGAEGHLPFTLGTAILLLAAIPVLLAFDTAPPVSNHGSARLRTYVMAVPLATFAALVFGAAESGGMAFLAIYGQRIGLDEANAVLLVTAVALGGIGFQIQLGLLSDRVDRRVLLVACGLVGAIGAFLAPLVSGSLPLLLAVLFVWGGITAGLYTVGLTHLGSRADRDTLASANAAFVFMYALGMLLGPAAAGWALDLWDPHGFPVVIGLLFLLYFLFGLWRAVSADAPGRDT